jgi:hypothetical protein
MIKIIKNQNDLKNNYIRIMKNSMNSYIYHYKSRKITFKVFYLYIIINKK